MTARKSKAIVVDASVLRSAGTTENPSSRLCREALLAMLDCGKSCTRLLGM
jgi:hypothetical protein